MILLDEPSMGLAPQIVEEIFEIVKSLKSKGEGEFSARGAKHQCRAALRDHGYILENGRVVMDGPPPRSPRTRTSRSSISAFPRRPQELQGREALPPQEAVACLKGNSHMRLVVR